MRPRFAIVLFMLLGCSSTQPRWHDSISRPALPELTSETFASFDTDSDVAACYEPPLSREAAFEVLLRTRVFARAIPGGPTIDGSLLPSVQAVAFDVLLARDDCRHVFLDLLGRAQLAGQLYALCGLWIVDRSEFERCADSLPGGGDSIYFANGCVHTFLPVDHVIRNEAGNDILSGSIPNEFEGAADLYSFWNWKCAPDPEGYGSED